MKAHLVSRRYARALFELAVEKNLLEWINNEITGFAALLTRNAKLRSILFSYRVERSKKIAMINELIQIDHTPLLRNFLLLLVKNARIQLFDEIADEFARLVDRRHNVLRVKIISAVPLPPVATERLRAILAQSFASQVILTNPIDPSILGGIIIATEGKVIDASVRQQLQRLTKQLSTARVATL